MIIYLYKKTHNKTGLQYLGKTVSTDPHKYQGSGTWWSSHINKHGYDVTTTILKECRTKEEVKYWGTYYSYLWNVVESNQWANLRLETGDGGDTSHTINYQEGIRRRPSRKGIPLSNEHIAKLRNPKKNKENYKHLIPPSHKDRIYINNNQQELRIYREELNQYPKYSIGKLKYTCPCGANVDIQNLKRWHKNCS